MKLILRFLLLIIAVFTLAISSNAQQVNTTYFLENAPMRHVINPAFQPVSNFYMTFPAVGYTSLWAGNNKLSLGDLVFNDGQGNTITALHPNAEGQLWNKLPNMLNVDADIHLSLFGFGWRIREKGYAHFNITERIITEVGMPKSMFGPLLQQDLNTWDFSSLRASATVYTDIALGYSHIINEHWTVGGKLKVLLGHTHMSGKFDDLQFNSNQEQAALVGSGTIKQAGILQAIAERQDINLSTISNVWNYLSPMGYGGAIDLGATYKPIQNLQITAAVTDLGFIHWKKGSTAALSIDTTFNGLGDFVYEDYVSGDNEFQSDSLLADITNGLEQYATALHIEQVNNKPFNQMLNATLNVGIDANFWKNRVGVGVYSRTRIHNNRISEEVTLGAAFRPVNWFHLAASYSFLNGKWSNIGGGISFALYDGFMFTVVADYVPLSYADYAIDDMVIPLPYKTRGLNVAFGIAIVAGTNPKKKRDKDKDGVLDKLDKCLNTPANVRVNTDGCPMDSDSDGIADYLDECSDTPAAAYGYIDSTGCPIDTDLDGVVDYMDECPNTVTEEREYVNASGCITDTDGDGIADYMDECSNTPAAAYGSIDAHGCPLDSDGDNVPDYLDQCPDTPKEAQGMIDQYGCPIDSDRDGVADYMDECPNTIVAARNQVNEKGCPIDTDGDGIYDYEDLCPTIAGAKSNTGCPEIKQQVRTILNKAMKGIQFENGKSTIKESSYGILNEVAKVFIENPNYIIEIQGHTDNVGNYQYNIDLSEKRAQAVRDYLIQHGVPAERMTAHGYGPDRPLTTNDTKEGRAVNRRVEFNITFEETTYIEQ
jgi:outer membrane protein OmpA-like peptidoglycan-associated protein